VRQRECVVRQSLLQLMTPTHCADGLPRRTRPDRYPRTKSEPCARA
jgi:hypothetical protein